MCGPPSGDHVPCESESPSFLVTSIRPLPPPPTSQRSVWRTPPCVTVAVKTIVPFLPVVAAEAGATGPRTPNSPDTRTEHTSARLQRTPTPSTDAEPTPQR